MQTFAFWLYKITLSDVESVSYRVILGKNDTMQELG